MLQFVCMRGHAHMHTGAYKYKLIQNINAISRPNFHVISNGSLICAVSLIFCAGKLIKLFTETVLAFNMLFQHIGLNLRKTQVHHSKKR